MGKQAICSVLAVCMLCVGVAWGETGFSGEATLVNARAASSELVVEGVTWRCESDKCIGRAERRSTLNSFIKDCRKVAAVVGPLASFAARGRVATQGEIKTCNRLAGKQQ
jgi:hypothetical protein